MHFHFVDTMDEVLDLALAPTAATSIAATA